jgi:hypothetical protein
MQYFAALCFCYFHYRTLLQVIATYLIFVQQKKQLDRLYFLVNVC